MLGIQDTHPSIARVQLDLLRSAGCGRRAALARSLSRTVIDLSRRELRARMVGASPAEVDLTWAAQQYGQALAARVRAYVLARRG